MMENIFSESKKDIPRKFSSIMMFIRTRLQEYFSYSHISQLKKVNDLFMELRNILHPQKEKDSVRADVEKMKTQRLSPKTIDYKLIRSEDYLEKLAKHFAGTNKGSDDFCLKKAV